MARFQDRGVIRQVDTRTGAVSTAQQLSASLNQFASQQAQFAQQRIGEQAQLAEVEGQAQFDADAPLAEQQREVPAFFGQEALAFNKGLRAAYVAGIDTDNRLEVTRIAQENPDNLLVFNDAIGAYRNSVLQEIDPSAQQVVAQSLDQQISSARIVVQRNTIKRQQKAIQETLVANITSANDSAERLARNGDKLGAAQELQNALATVDELSSSPEEKATIRRDLERGVTEQLLLGGLDASFEDGGSAQALDDLDQLSKKVPKGFTVDEWDSFISGAQTDITRKVARQRQATKEEIAAQKQAALVARGRLFLNPAIPADPAKGSADRKSIDALYEVEAASWQNLSAPEQVNLNVAFVENTGVMPKPLIANINAAMRSGTAEQAGLMSDLVSRIQETSPASLKDIPEESRAISLQVSDAVRAGIDPEQALEIARKATFGLSQAEKTTISMFSQAASKDLAGNLQSFADRDTEDGGFDVGIFSRVPDVPVPMQAEFKNSFDRFMQMTGGNVDQSEKLAYQATQSTWGVTETGGPKRFMKFAPEVIYQVQGVDGNWVEDQFNEDMEGAGALGAIMGIDNAVAREDRPSYPVLIADEITGIQRPLLNEDNVIVRWQPDFAQTEEYQELVSAPGDKVETSKVKRKKFLINRANKIRRMVQARLTRSIQFADPGQAGFDFETRAIEGDERLQETSNIITQMEANGKISPEEAIEARKGLGVE